MSVLRFVTHVVVYASLTAGAVLAITAPFILILHWTELLPFRQDNYLKMVLFVVLYSLIVGVLSAIRTRVRQ